MSQKSQITLSGVPEGFDAQAVLNELGKMPDSDMLHYESWFGRTTIMIQYWRSFEALERYAKNTDLKHRPAWAEFNRKINSNGDVGI